MTELDAAVTSLLGGRWSNHRTPDAVRPLALEFAAGDKTVMPSATVSVDDSDEIFIRVKAAMKDGFGGVILSGPPGTSKSWYAEAIARKLTQGDESRIRTVQFHASYQYEDFVQGFVPTKSGFEPTFKHLMVIARQALEDSAHRQYVLLIDELSRADPARVFGDALTYIEQSKRGKSFYLASGDTAVIPDNLFILGTMNEFDRGVDEVDAAFDRRMARITMDPNPELVSTFLATAGMKPDLAGRVLAFFTGIQKNRERAARIGHTYFIGLKDEDDLRRRWALQLSHVFAKAFRRDEDGLRRVKREWELIFTTAAGAQAGSPVPASGEAPETVEPDEAAAEAV